MGIFSKIINSIAPPPKRQRGPNNIYIPPNQMQQQNQVQPQMQMDFEVSYAGNNYMEFSVAGVTFNNDNGESRQAIISKMHQGEKLNFVISTFQGEPCIAIFNQINKQVGFVKREDISKILNYIERGCTAIVAKADVGSRTKCYYLIYKIIL